MRNHGQKLRAAIADLAMYGCDLADPEMNDGDRAEDAAFHLPYLEEYCGSALSVDEVIDAAREMMKHALATRIDPSWN